MIYFPEDDDLTYRRDHSGRINWFGLIALMLLVGSCAGTVWLATMIFGK